MLKLNKFLFELYNNLCLFTFLWPLSNNFYSDYTFKFTEWVLFFFRRESVSFLLKDQDTRVLVAFVSYKVWIMEISPLREPQLLCSSYCKHALCMRTTMNPCEGRSDRGGGVYLWTICMQNDGTFFHWKKQIDPTLPPADKVLEFPRHYKPVERQPGAGGDGWFVLRGTRPRSSGL